MPTMFQSLHFFRLFFCSNNQKKSAQVSFGRKNDKSSQPTEHSAIKHPIKAIKGNDALITRVIAEHQSGLTVMKYSRRDLFLPQLFFLSVTLNFEDTFSFSVGLRWKKKRKEKLRAAIFLFFFLFLYLFIYFPPLGPPPDVLRVFCAWSWRRRCAQFGDEGASEVDWLRVALPLMVFALRVTIPLFASFLLPGRPFNK